MNGSTTWKMHRNRLVGLIILMSVLLAAVSCGSAKITHESVVVKDTLVITKERVLHDTLTILKDTILYQDRVRVEVKYLKGEKVIVTAECPSDTIRVTQVKVVQVKDKKNNTWEFLLGWVIAILCLLVIIRTTLQKLL